MDRIYSVNMLFCLLVILLTITYQCLTGKFPFTANSPQALKEFNEKNINPVPEMPESTSPALRDKMLERNPNDRINLEDILSSPIVGPLDIKGPFIISTGSKWPTIAVFKQLGYLAVADMYEVGIKIYDLRSKQLIRTIKFTSTYDLKPFKETKLIQAGGDGEINIFDVKTGRLVTILKGHSSKDITAVELNKDESRMLSGGRDGNVILWDMVNYTQIRTFQRGRLPAAFSVGGHTDHVYGLVFNEPKNQVISGSRDFTIKVWNMNDGSLVRTLTGHSNTVFKLVLDEDTRLLYSASGDKTIKQWNVESGQCVKTLTGHTSDVYDLVLNQQGGWLASSSWDRSIIVWDKHTGSIINRLYHTDKLFRLALNPLNGQLISTSVNDGDVLFWD